MNVVVFEPRVTGGGHYFQYAGNLLQGLCDIGLSPTLLCGRDASRDTAFTAQIGSALLPGGSLENCQVQPLVPDVARNCDSPQALDAAIDTLKAYLTEHPTDWLFIPTADGLLQRMAVRLVRLSSGFAQLTGCEALLLNGRAGYRGRGVMRAKLSRRVALLAGCTRVHFVDPYSVGHLSQKPARYNVVSEPVEPLPLRSRDECQQRLSLGPLLTPLLGVVGRQDERKGMRLLVDALLSTDESMQPVSLLVAGQSSEFLESQLDRLKVMPTMTIVRRNGFLSDEALCDAIGACDALALPYTTPFQSSGILVRAGILGVPVVTSELGFLGRLCSQFGLGSAVDIYDPQALAAGVRAQLFNDPPRENSSAALAVGQASGDRAFLRAFHTLENTRLHWTYALRQHLQADDIVVPLSWHFEGHRISNNG